MITQNTLNITMHDLFLPNASAYASVSHSFTYTSSDLQEEFLSLTAEKSNVPSVQVDSVPIDPQQQAQGRKDNDSILNTGRYRLSLSQGTHHIKVEYQPPVRERTANRFFDSRYNTLYTLYYDFITLRRLGVEESTPTDVIVHIPQKLPYIVRFLRGRYFIRFGSKSREEEKGILHKTRIRSANNGVKSVLHIPYSLPDQLAITVGLTGVL